MRRLPPLNAIRVFEVAARCRSFSAAAHELCVTHSAVSHQIRILEDWLGQPVFLRHAGGIAATASGLALQQAAAQALGLLEQCCTDIAKQVTADDIVLGAPGSFLANWLIPRLERFEMRHPEIRLRLQTASGLAPLQQGRVDVLVLGGEGAWPDTIAAVALLDERVGPVCAPDYPTLPLQASDLPCLPLLHTASRPQAWAGWARAQGLDPDTLRQGRRFDHLPLMLEAAAAGLGLAIAPALLVERELESGRLIAPLGFVASGTSFDMCVLSGRKDEIAIARIREWLQHEAAR
ncbi:LysR substrate-binding domain-containing protein [Paludibacterium yongneupense]|uniref:LysR substrate-binding domain-containing protein n=1 Tax=Paludibacterium yongneupense TaxID=400061 RepID=UPI0004051CC9|nr:LysR substrate-binding domain-containing protein [Paludibacterium yongneupense]